MNVKNSIYMDRFSFRFFYWWCAIFSVYHNALTHFKVYIYPFFLTVYPRDSRGICFFTLSPPGKCTYLPIILYNYMTYCLKQWFYIPFCGTRTLVKIISETTNPPSLRAKILYCFPFFHIF